MSRVITVERCIECPYCHMPSLYRKLCGKAQWREIECDSSREFPAWCPLPESGEKEESK